jgi:hypothetical protein
MTWEKMGSSIKMRFYTIDAKQLIHDFSGNCAIGLVRDFLEITSTTFWELDNNNMCRGKRVL